ncbi:transposase [Parasporobacterium paucivorans DSM 15970]|uniref:Transposase n=1 Tax=Parasporobacterium paucivorans DSM 15970 TaxID=1122934 RepID=A0A1M6LUQ5_9FIRM|nr:transposase [Parasporobacterium paucivorans DSM 15970]
MAKYSFEFKKQIVTDYQNGKGGYCFLAEKYHIKNNEQVRKWIKAYQTFGDEGLMRSRKNESYSFEFKLHVVELYLTTEISYQELALSVGINNPPLIAKWVNDFRIAGPDVLRPKRKGRRRTVDKSKDITPDIPTTSNVNTEYIKQLEDELLKLKIENAYLKELRRLRLEGTPQNKKRESSTASEDPSN